MLYFPYLLSEVGEKDYFEVNKQQDTTIFPTHLLDACAECLLKMFHKQVTASTKSLLSSGQSEPFVVQTLQS